LLPVHIHVLPGRHEKGARLKVSLSSRCTL
jgi:hypothetical protein